MRHRLAPRERTLTRPLTGLWLCLALTSPAAAHLGIHAQIRDLDALLTRDPRAADLYLRRGELHQAHGDLELALRDFERALALDPACEASFRIGRAHLEAGRADDARPALDRALARRPDHVEALVARGRALATLGRHLDSAADFERAIQAHTPPENPEPDLYLMRASALAAAGGETRLTGALRGLDEGMARLGPAVSLQLAAIDLEVRLGRHDAALERLDDAAARAPRKERWLARRGEILEQAGRLTEARSAFEAALSAIGALPAPRRSVDAVGTLEGDVRAALGRLATAGMGSDR